MEQHDIVIGEHEVWGGRKFPFGLRDPDRAFHVYLSGRSGMGKTTLLREMLRQDIEAGKGCGLIDPHGDISGELLHFIPRSRIDDVVYIDPSLSKYQVVINPFYRPPADPNARALIGYNVVSTFKHLWHDAWGDTRLQYILTNIVLALLDAPDDLRPTLASIPLMLVNDDYRARVARAVQNDSVKRYFEGELALWNKRYLDEALGPVQNRIGQFLMHPAHRHIFGSWQPTIDFREAIDEGKILIVRVPKGTFGEEPTNYFGSFAMSGLQTAAMARAELPPEEERRPFYLYVDEFQNVGTDATMQIFSEARKFGLYLTVAHQYLDQLDDPVRSAVFGNVGSYVSFRVSQRDAEILAREIDGFNAQIISELGQGEVVAQLLQEQTPSTAIKGRTFPPSHPTDSHAREIKRQCRKRYCVRTEKVEDAVVNWLRQFS